MAFLKLKNFSSLYSKVIIFATLLLIIEAYTNFFTKLHIPTAQLMLIYPIVAIIIFFKTRFIYILFYVIGWSVLIASLFFIELQIIFFKEHLILADNLMHIVMPLESLIFALAISYKMRLESLEKQQKEQMLIHYDKKASIGDMVDNIAHQWRQPLTHIGYIVMNISAAIKNDKFTTTLWDKKHSELTTQLNYMSETITSFRDFYKPSTKKEHFDVEEVINKILLIIESKLRTHDIELQIKKHTNLKIYGNENEFAQVLLNLLINAQEAFETQDKDIKTIVITIKENEILVDDNAGGVNEEFRKKMFEPYMSTKQNGSGIGLAMSRLIIEKNFDAKLEYEELSNGSRFKILT
jgi:signal transduction histidine kinase